MCQYYQSTRAKQEAHAKEEALVPNRSYPRPLTHLNRHKHARTRARAHRRHRDTEGTEGAYKPVMESEPIMESESFDATCRMLRRELDRSSAGSLCCKASKQKSYNTSMASVQQPRADRTKVTPRANR